MKHLRKFLTDKDVANIEDLLVKFQDENILEEVSVWKGTDCIRIEFEYVNEPVGYEKFKILDEIVKRLNKTYPYVKVYNDCIMVYSEESDERSITNFSLVDKIKSDLSKMFSGAKLLYTISDDFTFFYGRTSKRPLVKFYSPSGDISVDEELIWEKFREMHFMPEGTDDISTILKDFISKRFKIEPKKIRDVWYESL